MFKFIISALVLVMVCACGEDKVAPPSEGGGSNGNGQSEAPGEANPPVADRADNPNPPAAQPAGNGNVENPPAAPPKAKLCHGSYSRSENGITTTWSLSTDGTATVTISTKEFGKQSGIYPKEHCDILRRDVFRFSADCSSLTLNGQTFR